MNRFDFQVLAEVRIDEASALLGLQKYDGAYYLAGYAVECGLKACIAKLIGLHEFPDKQFAQRCYTHNIEELVGAAGLRAARDADILADPQLASSWDMVKDWAESSRYERKLQTDAEALINAIADPANGVLPWIRQRW